MTPEERNQRIHGTLEMLMQDYRGGRTIDEIKTFFHPDKEAVIEVLNKLQRIIFPGYFRNKTFRVYTVRNNVSMLLEDTVYNLIKQISIVLRYQRQNEGKEVDTPEIMQEITEEAEDLTFRFLETIPRIREYLDTDVQAEYVCDKTQHSKEEIKVTVKFDRSVKWRIIDECGADKLKYDKEGNILLTFTWSDVPSLFQFILSFDDQAEILEPAEYREEFARHVKKILSHYER